jgi:CRISPR-associated protein Csx3
VVETLIHPRDLRTGLTYSILPMIHAIADDLLTPDEAAHHLQLIRDHLLGPDGARLFDRPVGYAGGPMTLFQRAEASTSFGREIGMMYMHAHLRYAEALARVGDGPGLLVAMALAQSVGMTDRVASARPRQSTCYYTSSDAAFADRYAARDGYRGIFDHTVPLEGGWRVYSSGPGLFLQLLVRYQLGLRAHGATVEIDPVLDPGLDGLVVQVPLLGVRRTLRYAVGARGHGDVSVRAGGQILSTLPLGNPYRGGGVSVRAEDLRRAFGDSEVVVEIETG